MTRNPFVFWSQTASHVHLRVDLRDVRSHNIHVEEDAVEFAAVGTGAGGADKKYSFDVEFYLPVRPESAKCDVSEHEVRISLVKKDEGDWWPRLLYTQQKLAWLKVDFDRFRSGDSDPDEDDDDNERAASASAQDLLRNKYPDVFRKMQQEELGFISEGKKKVYLFMYNLFMFCGFLYVSSVMGLKYARSGDEFVGEAWRTVGDVVKMLHLLMILEVLHPLFGYTKGSVVEAALQVFGRNFVLLALIDSEPRMQEKPVVCYLIVVYSAVELVRYPYYMLRVYDLDVGLVTYLRYTAWIPLYPAGFFCEAVVALRDIPYFEETERFSVALPNAWNVSFYFPTLLRVYLLFFFFPMLYTMMMHMYQLRCKKLGIKQHEKNKRKKYDD